MSTPTANPHRAIAPRQRLAFLLRFVLATEIGLLVGMSVAGRVQERLFGSLGSSPRAVPGEGNGIVPQLVAGLVIGAMLGIAQWLAMRRYVPSWGWIVATAGGWVLSSATSAAITTAYLDRLLWQNQSGDLVLRLSLSAGIQGIIGTVCFLMLGLGQWWVLRRFFRASWWIVVPALAVLVASAVNLLWLVALLQLGWELGEITDRVSSVVPFAVQGLSLGLLQGWGLCVLARPQVAKAKPEFEYEDIQALSQQLRDRLSHLWSGEIAGEEPLVYLISVDRDGAIVYYQPINQVSFDNIDQTPLPDLVKANDADENSATGIQFRATFTPNGELDLQYWG
jgi:hypothetical protein